MIPSDLFIGWHIVSQEERTFEIAHTLGYHVSVFQQSDGRLKCLLCDRYKCVHAKFVQWTIDEAVQP